MTENDVDLRYISLGAGVQSTAMYALAAEGRITPMPRFAIFADTQAEPPWVYEQLDVLDRRWGHKIPIHRVTRGSLEKQIEDAAASVGTKRKVFSYLPLWVRGKDGKESLGRRQCTSKFKIDVITKHVRYMLGLKLGQRAAGKFVAEAWIGISLDEAHRMKPSQSRWIRNRWPLLFDLPMRRHQCERELESLGLSRPQKSACFFCPYRNNKEWREIRDKEPNLWERACELDEMMRQNGTGHAMRNYQYFHRSLTPLREAKIDEEDDGQIDLFGNECEGMCGV